MSILNPKSKQMNEITEYKQKTHVTLKDWRVLTTDSTPKQIFDWLKDNSHIMIEGEMHIKFSIVSATQVSMDDIESLIQAQTKEIQNKVRQKRKRLKEEMWKDMTIDYLKNYLSKLTN